MPLIICEVLIWRLTKLPLGASLIGAIGVYLAHVLSPIGITIFVGLSGVIAILLLYMIMPAIYERRKQFNEI